MGWAGGAMSGTARISSSIRSMAPAAFCTSPQTSPRAPTALAAMIGALFILDDPIFNGLAISLIFGILVSTLLTLVVIPLLYYALLSRRS